MAFFNSIGFFIFEKGPIEIFFCQKIGQLDFLCRFCRFKDDFGIFLDTVSGHRMLNFHWKFCTRIHHFLFCCFMLLGLQF